MGGSKGMTDRRGPVLAGMISDLWVDPVIIRDFVLDFWDLGEESLVPDEPTVRGQGSQQPS